MKAYTNTLYFILQLSIKQLYPTKLLVLDYVLPNGMYGEVREHGVEGDGTPWEIQLSPEEVNNIKQRCLEIIAQDLPITQKRLSKDEASALFLKNGQVEKSRLALSSSSDFVNVDFLDGYPDTFYGPQLSSTGKITHFDLVPFSYGFCLQLNDHKYQNKLSAVFKENANWNSIMGASGAGSLNNKLRDGKGKNIIQIAEALHEKKYASIADMIYQRKDNVKLVLIAGPSSSGKTTTSKRIELQCRVLGIKPVVIAMDNYFVERERTPKDEKGDYNFEHIDALDRKLLSKQLNALFNGEEVIIPTFNFKEGRPIYTGEKTRLHENEIIIMEGIHALNPLLIEDIDPKQIFRIYASALTSLSLDENNCIHTTDNRLLRRMIRDNRTRGVSPEGTILRWQSVRNGEEVNIFPFQENSDVMFNSALLFELPLLKHYATPLLENIASSSPAYEEAQRLLNFLSHFHELSQEEIAIIPPTSIMREFIGGSSFDY